MSRYEVICQLCLMAKYSPLYWPKIKAIPENGIVHNTLICKKITHNGAFVNFAMKCIMSDKQFVAKMQHRIMNILFEHHILLEATLKLAMQNNVGHLYSPFHSSSPAYWCFTAYRRYCPWVCRKVGKSNTGVIPLCIQGLIARSKECLYLLL